MKEKIEFTILRYLGRPPSLFDDQAIAEVQKILAGNAKLDWDKFTEYAVFHKLSQTLYPNLRKFEEKSIAIHASPTAMQDTATNTSASVPYGATSKKDKDTCGGNPGLGIPEVVVKKFQGIFFANAARNEFLAQELVKINQLMSDNGIEMLNWKGPTLALQAYGDLSRRQFKDLDTFVKQEDLEKAKAVLQENGFDYAVKPRNELKFELINKNKNYEFELQSKLFTGRSVVHNDYDEIFNRSQTLAINGQPIKTFSDLDNLLFLSFHGTYHLWFRLRWLVDIILIYKNNEQEILEKIKNSDNKTFFAFSLYLAHKELMLDIPIEIVELCSQIGDLEKFIKILRIKILSSNYSEKFVDYYWRARILEELLTDPQNKKSFEKEKRYYNCVGRIYHKIMPNQADYNFIKLPKALWLLYFIVRPTRVFLRFLKSKQIIS